MASYFRRILRQCQSGIPSGLTPPTAAQWNTIVSTLIGTGTATYLTATFTLTNGIVVVT